MNATNTVSIPDRERREAGARRLCRRLAADIAAVAPEGLGSWPPAWELVEAPSGRFLDRLHEWVETGDDELGDVLRYAYVDVVAAWKTAADRWQRQNPGFMSRTSLAGTS